MLKKIISLAFMCVAFMQALAQQPVEGLNYYLPQTVVKVRLLVQHTNFKPGRLAVYGQTFLRRQCGMEAVDTYRICGASMYASAQPDTSRHYTVNLDRKKLIFNVECDKNGVLMAVMKLSGLRAGC